MAFGIYIFKSLFLAPKKNSKAASLSNELDDTDINLDAQFIDNFEEFLADPKNKTSQLLIPILNQLNYLKEKARKNVLRRIAYGRSEKLKSTAGNNSENGEPAMFGLEETDEPAMFGLGENDEPAVFGLGNAESDEELQVPLKRYSYTFENLFFFYCKFHLD